MKLAITSQGPDLSATVDSRFGRAACFLVVDTESGAFEVADNQQNLQAAQGAGIQAGRTVLNLGVDAVVTGHVGPKAFATLQAGGVQVYLGVTGTVAEAVEQVKTGQLKPTTSADVEGHW